MQGSLPLRLFFAVNRRLGHEYEVHPNRLAPADTGVCSLCVLDGGMSDKILPGQVTQLTTGEMLLALSESAHKQSGQMKSAIRIRCVRMHPDAKVPTQATPGSVGWDLYSPAAHTVKHGTTGLIETGLCIELPDNYEAQVRPRSGFTRRGVVTCVGTIDSDYRSGIGVILLNMSGSDLEIQPGDRIGQLVIARVPPIEWCEVEQGKLSDTARSGGYGSTGR
jgi:dUTP diphosphatase